MVVLAALLIGLPMSHLEIETSDGSWLLRVDGRPVDVAGQIAQRYTALTRNCTQVRTLAPTDPLHAQVLAAVRQYSPPDSGSARLVHLAQHGQWLLAQVRFSGLQDAVVLLQGAAGGVTIPAGGIWSGATHPHLAEPMIRRYLQNAVPAAPLELTACFAHQL